MFCLHHLSCHVSIWNWNWHIFSSDFYVAWWFRGPKLKAYKMFPGIFLLQYEKTIQDVDGQPVWKWYLNIWWSFCKLHSRWWKLTAYWFLFLPLIAHAVIMTACWFLFLALIVDAVILVELKCKIKKYQYSCLCYRLI